MHTDVQRHIRKKPTYFEWINLSCLGFQPWFNYELRRAQQAFLKQQYLPNAAILTQEK